jgi:hypothetical protein
MSRSQQRRLASQFGLTTEEAPGAIPNGTRVQKIAGDPTDAHVIGDLATVIGSMGPAELDGVSVYGYFVHWDDMPEVPVFVAGIKIAEVKEQ